MQALLARLAGDASGGGGDGGGAAFLSGPSSTAATPTAAALTSPISTGACSALTMSSEDRNRVLGEGYRVVDGRVHVDPPLKIDTECDQSHSATVSC